jgi:hypothetical protein
VNKLEEVEAGLEHDSDVIYMEYRHPDRDPWRTQVLPILRQLPQWELAEAAGLSVRRLRDLLTERAQPRTGTAGTLAGVARAARALTFAEDENDPRKPHICSMRR